MGTADRDDSVCSFTSPLLKSGNLVVRNPNFNPPTLRIDSFDPDEYWSTFLDTICLRHFVYGNGFAVAKLSDQRLSRYLGLDIRRDGADLDFNALSLCVDPIHEGLEVIIDLDLRKVPWREPHFSLDQLNEELRIRALDFGVDETVAGNSKLYRNIQTLREFVDLSFEDGRQFPLCMIWNSFSYRQSAVHDHRALG
jgi:hypothetical protein